MFLTYYGESSTEEKNNEGRPQGGDASPSALQVLTDIGGIIPPGYALQVTITVNARSIVSFTHLSTLLSRSLSVRSLLLPSLYHFANFFTSHVPFHEPSSNNFMRAFSTKLWRTRNSGGHLRRTWALPVPVRANKLTKLQAPLPVPAIHIFSQCECDVAALRPETADN
jgi:hypothetical protein